MRLINADALKKAFEEDMAYGGVKTDDFDKGYDLGIKKAIEILDNAPAVDLNITDIKALLNKLYGNYKGEWIEKTISTFPQYQPDEYECPFCHHIVNYKTNFCPYCGAYMRGEDNG